MKTVLNPGLNPVMDSGCRRATELIQKGRFACACGRDHGANVKEVIIGRDALSALPGVLGRLGAARAYIVSDRNTERAAGGRVAAILDAAGFRLDRFVFDRGFVEPDEPAVGAAVLNMCGGPASEDPLAAGKTAVVAVGSGVINDICKILAHMTGAPFVTVATAPSMDGFCSSTSSVLRGGLKVSVGSRCPDAVVGDTEILCAAPENSILAGLGDMIAKYVALFEWKLGHIVTGEYYCELTANLMREALEKVVSNAAGLKNREPEAIEAVMEGLVISGIAMDYAGISRPASGIEHYFSHIWDMRGVSFGTPVALHGIQCGIGTVLALEGYEKLFAQIAKMNGSKPDYERARRAHEVFDVHEHAKKIAARLGPGGEIIAEDLKNRRLYDRADTEERLRKIAANYELIKAEAEKTLPSAHRVADMLRDAGAPVRPSEIGLPDEEIPVDFVMTRDIRDKYILSSFAYDLGINIDFDI
ncbi:MAG: sn-glycerol-1-phosphate dehydrogenase [Clostridia bacterium]|nr:sn-glycerol-1-phosphate dehydrogenase [Clostridia bacterium]